MKEYNGIDISNYSVTEIDNLCNQIRNNKLFAGIVYCYKNKINNKRYIGQTINPILRHKAHIKYSQREDYRDCKNPIHLAIKKYGIESFEYKVLDLIVAEHDYQVKILLNAHEIVNIYNYQSDKAEYGYNATIGGNIVGVGELHPNSKPVEEYNLKTQELIATYPSLMAAGKAHNVTDSIIRNLCKHKSFSKNGSVFCFKGETPIFIDPNKNKHQIHQHSLKGEWIKAYESLDDAAEESGATKSGISQALNAGIGSHKSGEYLWYFYRYTGCKSWEEPKDKMFIYDKDGNFIQSFKGIMELAKYWNYKGISHILDAIRNPSMLIKGCYVRIKRMDNANILDGYNPNEYFRTTVVSAYNISGHLVRTFENMTQAARYIGLKSESKIRKAIATEYTLVNNWYWRKGNNKYIDTNNIPLPPERIVAYNKENNNVIAKFASISEAAIYFNVCVRNISVMLKGQIVHDQSLQNVIFKYK